MSPSISIIVPVYKAEAYLHRCVDSLLAQTFTDFEVLLIDDGSPDRSGEICDDYARKDARVRVFHQPNGGVSVARQRGLDEALGEYTIHADPDDRVEPDMLEELYRKAKEDDADMVICDYYYEVGRTQSVIRQKETGHSARSVLKDIFRMNVSACFWNKLIRRQVYCVNDVRLLPKMNIGEDYYAVARLLTKIKNVSFVHRPLYHYIKNETSLTQQSIQCIQQRVLLLKLIKTLAKDNGVERYYPYVQLMVMGDLIIYGGSDNKQFDKISEGVTTFEISKSSYPLYMKFLLYVAQFNYKLAYSLYKVARKLSNR